MVILPMGNRKGRKREYTYTRISENPIRWYRVHSESHLKFKACVTSANAAFLPADGACIGRHVVATR